MRLGKAQNGAFERNLLDFSNERCVEKGVSTNSIGNIQRVSIIDSLKAGPLYWTLYSRETVGEPYVGEPHNLVEPGAGGVLNCLFGMIIIRAAELG